LVFVASPHVALRSKSKDCFTRNQNNVSEWTKRNYLYSTDSIILASSHSSSLTHIWSRSDYTVMCGTTNVVSSNPDHARCTRYNIMWYILSVTCDRSVVFSSFLHQENLPPQYNWNIVESANTPPMRYPKSLNNLIGKGCDIEFVADSVRRFVFCFLQEEIVRPATCSNYTYLHNITEILLKVSLNIIAIQP
jgi:hypothetical protein